MKEIANKCQIFTPTNLEKKGNEIYKRTQSIIVDVLCGARLLCDCPNEKLRRNIWKKKTSESQLRAIKA